MRVLELFLEEKVKKVGQDNGTGTIPVLVQWMIVMI